MSVQHKTKKGKTITLLNPFEKGKKYYLEQMANVRTTNSGEIKDDGKPLTPEQKAYRAGYLAAQKDSRKAFKHKHPDYKNKVVK